MKVNFLLIMILAFFLTNIDSIHAKDDPTKKVAKTSINVIYYHGNKRCATCNKIEKYSKGALKKYYRHDMKSGKLKWGSINFEKKENAHLAKRHDLYTQTLIISIVKNGKVIKWKACPEIWVHTGNQKDFESYIKKEVKTYMKELDG